jgi:hypothetical protein
LLLLEFLFLPVLPSLEEKQLLFWSHGPNRHGTLLHCSVKQNFVSSNIT